VLVLSQKGAKGNVGGDGFIGYSHEFDDNLVIGVQVSAGYTLACSRAAREMPLILP
jgi:hypothetical protein